MTATGASNQHDAYLQFTRSLVRDRDPAFAAKFVDVPGYITEWLSHYIDLRGRRILDFGCGDGVITCAMASVTQAAEVVGVDVRDKWVHLASRLVEGGASIPIPENLRFEHIDHGEVASCGSFDLIYSWSVFEHVCPYVIPKIISGMVDRLACGGFVYLQISPLYHSPEGGHLWAAGYRQWEHLIKSPAEIYQGIFRNGSLTQEGKTHLWELFNGLNKVTADDLMHMFCSQGLTVRMMQKNATLLPVPSLLASRYDVDVLRTEQIVALFQKD